LTQIYEFRRAQALDAGITEDQIVDAVGVDIELGRGPATVTARFAMNVLSY
jgi:alkylhydroperoxidase/carboxymuconolactone decarboxylase family protein YurZ